MAYSPIFGDMDWSALRPFVTGSTSGSRTAGGNVFGYKPVVPGLTSPKTSLLGASPIIGDILNLASQNVQKNLMGELSDAVTNRITDTLAARGVGAGVGGSNLLNYALASAQGDAAQNLQNLGFEQTMALAPTVSKLYTNQPLDIFNTQYLKALVDAAPDPAARANWEISQFGRFLGGGAGGAPATSGPYAGLNINYPGLNTGYTPPPASRTTSPAPMQSAAPARSTGTTIPISQRPIGIQRPFGADRVDWNALPVLGDTGPQSFQPFEQTVYTPPYAGPYEPSYYTPTTRTVTPSNVIAPLEDPMYGFTYPNYIPPAPTRGVMPGASNSPNLSPNRSVFTSPSNWGELTGEQQSEYVDAQLRYAGVNPDDYE